MDGVRQLCGNDGRRDKDSIGDLGTGHHRDFLHTRAPDGHRCGLTKAISLCYCIDQGRL